MTLAAIVVSAFLAVSPQTPAQAPPDNPTAQTEQAPGTAPSATQPPQDPTVPLAQPRPTTAPQTPDQTSPVSGTEPQAQQSTQNSKSAAPATKSKKSAKKKSKKGAKKKTEVAENSDEPVRKVVRNGSTQDPQLDFVPGVTATQASRQRQDTERLLGIADANLKQSSTRTLTAAQQDTVNQIKLYIEQSKQAVTAGELQRAHNLAFKAQLLSNELVRQ